MRKVLRGIANEENSVIYGLVSMDGRMWCIVFDSYILLLFDDRTRRFRKCVAGCAGEHVETANLHSEVWSATSFSSFHFSSLSIIYFG